MSNPSDLRYSKEHEWARLEGDNVVVGITTFAAEQLGDVVYVDLPSPGTKVEQFGKFGEIESVKTMSDLFSPVGGEVVEVNEALKDIPESVNSDTYGEGWLIKVKIHDRGQLDALMDASEYDSHIS